MQLVFIVSSDDLEWCKKEFKKITGESFHYSTKCPSKRQINNPNIFDMALLSKCPHSIYDYGTYGFWTAYLSQGHTILASEPGNGENPEITAIREAKIENWHFIPAHV